MGKCAPALQGVQPELLRLKNSALGHLGTAWCKLGILMGTRTLLSEEL